MKFTRKLSAGLLAVLCLFTLSACQNNQQRQAANQKKVSRSDDSLPTGNYFSDDSQQKVNNYQRKKALTNVTGQMNKNYKKIGNVKNSGNVITLNLTGSQMQQLVQSAQQNDSQAKKFWNQLTKGMQKTSKNLSGQLRDSQLTLKIMSPNNNLLYSVSDGNVNTNKLK